MTFLIHHPKLKHNSQHLFQQPQQAHTGRRQGTRHDATHILRRKGHEKKRQWLVDAVYTPAPSNLLQQQLRTRRAQVLRQLPLREHHLSAIVVVLRRLGQQGHAEARRLARLLAGVVVAEDVPKGQRGLAHVHIGNELVEQPTATVDDSVAVLRVSTLARTHQRRHAHGVAHASYSLHNARVRERDWIQLAHRRTVEDHFSAALHLSHTGRKYQRFDTSLLNLQTAAFRHSPFGEER